MIHYNVRCSHDHEFDGWYKDSAAFDRLSKRGLVECPVCGDVKVQRAMMAPAVSTRQTLSAPPQASTPPAPAPARQTAPAGQPSAPPVTMAGGPLPDQMRAMLQRMRAEVEKRCDYVGPSFAEEARKIHRGEAEERGIGAAIETDAVEQAVG